MTLQRKKKPFLTFKNRIFQTPENRTFSMGLIHTFGQKMPFSLDFDLIKIRLEITLSNFEEKKETIFGLEKRNISKSRKSHFFKGLTHAFT